MTEQQMIDCLLYELAKKDKLNIRRNNIITFLSIVLMAISILNVALQDHYKSQITELRTQLSRTQKQLKRASDDRARQTKRIAELTGNGGQGMIDEILKRLNKEFDNDLDNYGQESYAGYMAAIGVAIEIVEEVKRGSK